MFHEKQPASFRRIRSSLGGQSLQAKKRQHQSLDGHEKFLSPVPVQSTSNLKAHTFLSDHSSKSWMLKLCGSSTSHIEEERKYYLHWIRQTNESGTGE